MQGNGQTIRKKPLKKLSAERPDGRGERSCIWPKRSKQMKGSEQRHLLEQNATCELSGESPLSSYKTTVKQQINGEKR